MRIDITQTVKVSVMKGIKLDYSKIAKQFNCDPRREGDADKKLDIYYSDCSLIKLYL